MGPDASISPAAVRSPSAMPVVGTLPSANTLAQEGVGKAYTLLPRVCDVPVRLKQRADVECLSTPQVPVYGPIKCQLERTAVKGPVHISDCYRGRPVGVELTEQPVE